MDPRLGPQFKYPETPEEINALGGPVADQLRRVHDLYGTQDLDAAIPNSSVGMTPWPAPPRSKAQPKTWDARALREASRNPEYPLTDIDPRHLHTSQPKVTYGGVKHYLESDEYERTGETFADQNDLGNKFPMIYAQKSGRNIIASGHHRAYAALLRGEPLRGRRVEGEI